MNISKTSIWLIFIIPASIFLGIWVMITLFSGLENKSQEEILAMYFMVPLFALIFFGFPILVFAYQRSITWENGIWTISYRFLKRKIQFNKWDIDEIEIIENIRGRGISNHEVVKIKLKENKKVEISSLELNNYDELRKQLNKDFKQRITITQFGKKSPIIK